MNFSKVGGGGNSNEAPLNVNAFLKKWNRASNNSKGRKLTRYIGSRQAMRKAKANAIRNHRPNNWKEYFPAIQMAKNAKNDEKEFLKAAKY